MDTLEIVLAILSMGTGVLLFLLNRQKTRLDNIEARMDLRVDNVQAELKTHEVSDATNLITRQETETKMETLKEDLRKIISPLSESIIRIEGYLIKHPN